EEFGSAAFKARLAGCTLPFGGNRQPLESIIDALSKPPYECKSVIVESDYVDKDYQDEHAAFYCKAFKKYPPRCVRLHFFGQTIPPGVASDFGKFAAH